MEIKSSKTKLEKVIKKLTLKKNKNKTETVQASKTKNNENNSIKNEIKKLIGESLIETYLKLINTIDKKNFTNNDSNEDNAIEKLRESFDSSLIKNNSPNSQSLELILIDEEKNENSESKNSSSVVIKKPNVFEGITHYVNKSKNLNNNQINNNKNDNLIIKENKKIFMKLEERNGDTNDCEYEFLIFSNDNSLRRNNSNKLSSTKNSISSKYIEKKNKKQQMILNNKKLQNYHDNNYYNINMKESEKNNNEVKISQSSSKRNIKDKEISLDFQNINKSCFTKMNDSTNHNINNCKKRHEISPKLSYSKNSNKNKNQIINNTNKNNLCQNTEVKKKTYSVFQLSKDNKKKEINNETKNKNNLTKVDSKKLSFGLKKAEKNINKSNNDNSIKNNNNSNDNNNNTNIINYSFGNKIIKVYYVNNGSDNKINDSMKKYKIIKKEKNITKKNISKNQNYNNTRKNNVINKRTYKTKNNFYNSNNINHFYKNENHESKLLNNKSAQTFQDKYNFASKLCNNYSYINKINDNPFNVTTISFRNFIKYKIKEENNVNNIIRRYSRIFKRKMINNSRVFNTDDK